MAIVATTPMTFKINEEKVKEMLANGVRQKHIAESEGCSVPTIRAKIAELKAKRGDVVEYKDLEFIRIAQLKSRVLDQIEHRLENGEISPGEQLDLLNALSKAEQKAAPAEESMEGLMAHLMEVEKEQRRVAGLKKVDEIVDKVLPPEPDYIDVTGKHIPKDSADGN